MEGRQRVQGDARRDAQIELRAAERSAKVFAAVPEKPQAREPGRSGSAISACFCQVHRPARLASSLLPDQAHGTTMLRLTALLIVVTLTGLPVIPTACLMWCGTQDTTTTRFCHDEARNGSVFISSANVTCRALVTEDWFIREEMRPVLHAVYELPVSRTTVLPALATAHSFTGHDRGATDARATHPIVLRV